MTTFVAGQCVNGHAYGEQPGCLWCGRLPKMKPLIIGEQPSKTGNPDQPVSGRIGHRLAEFMLLTYDEFDRMFDRVNLLYQRAEYSGKSDEWNATAAKQMAHKLAISFTPGQVVLLLGKRAARAFDLSDEYFVKQNVAGAEVYAVPHPSGLNRWWNDPYNKIEAREFLRGIAKRYV